MSQLHAALFIDYDNVRAELERFDPSIAARFSNKTLFWLEALEKHLKLPEGLDTDGRRIVSRRCYASPYRINNFRRNFTQAGFEVIDCPPLTTHLKNSADIYIVMDVVDYLQRYPHIDEYIILSADADFVPVLNRLRKELKKSAIFTAYNTTSAYRNCADRTIEVDFFAEHLAIETVAPRAAQESARAETRIEAPPAAPPALQVAVPVQTQNALATLSRSVETCLLEASARRFGRLPFAAAAQALRDQLPAELGGNWAGYRTFTALLEHVKLDRLEADWEAQELSDPDFELPLEDWDEGERGQLREFIGDVMWSSSKPMPLLRPGDYSLVFDELAAYYRQEESGTFTECMNAVAERCRARGVKVSAQEVRFIATGISMQQYRFVEGADAQELAALWRVQVYDLCGDPDWMRKPDEAELLATWLHATGESVEDARADFLARTGDEPGEAAEPASA